MKIKYWTNRNNIKVMDIEWTPDEDASPKYVYRTPKGIIVFVGRYEKNLEGKIIHAPKFWVKQKNGCFFLSLTDYEKYISVEKKKYDPSKVEKKTDEPKPKSSFTVLAQKVELPKERRTIISWEQIKSMYDIGVAQNFTGEGIEYIYEEV